MESYFNTANEFFQNEIVTKLTEDYNTFLAKRKQFLLELSSVPEKYSESEKSQNFSLILTDTIREQTEKEFASIIAETESLISVIENPACEEYLKSLPGKVKVEEQELHFVASEADNFTVRVVKSFKRGYLPVYRFFRKNKSYWDRKVPVRGVVTYFNGKLLRKLLAVELADKLKQVISEYRALTELFRELEILCDEVSDENQARNIFTENVNQLAAKLDSDDKIPGFAGLSGHITKGLKESLDTAGTVMLASGKFNDVHATGSGKEASLILKNLNRDIDNYLKILQEKDALIFDVIKSVTITNREAENFSGLYMEGFRKNELETLNSISTAIEKETKNYTPDSDLKNFLVDMKENFKSILTDEHAVKLIENIPFSGVKPIAEKLVYLTEKSTGYFNSSYRLIRIDDIRFGDKFEKYKDFDPVDIVKTLYIRESREKINRISVEISGEYGKAVQNIIECPDIVEYNIDTAIDVLNENPAKTAEAKKIAFEGITRVITKLNEAKNILEQANERYYDDLTEVRKTFINEFRTVLNVTKVTGILIQLSKERAVEKAKSLAVNSRKYVKSGLPILAGKIKAIITGSRNLYGELSKKVGLSESSGEISAEISDYLLEVESNVAKLPRVYQRLFRYEALTEEKFFVGRENELLQIKSAHDRWKHGHHASLAITGEKGAGTSTLLNFAATRFLPSKRFIRTELKETIYSEKMLNNFLADLFSCETEENEEKFISFLRKKYKGYTVVIENGEDLFLRIPEGFSAVNMLFRIITYTSGEIFWIVTFNKYTWNYLAKTVNIKDYFTNITELAILGEKLTAEIIERRHAVSGYKIVFEPGNVARPGFNKLSPEAQQAELKKIYFESLNKLSEGNIALALVFWLRSVARFDKEVIYISDINDLDFSFVKNLADHKHFSLTVVLLHDGITLEEYMAVFNISRKEAELFLLALLDDGILFRRGDRYKVNFLLYRQVIDSLKTKNILH